MNQSDVDTLLSKIERAWDKRTGDYLDLEKVRIEKRQDHEKKPAIYRFCHEDDVYNRKNHIMLRYKCLTCDRENMCALNNVMQRVNKGYKWCNVCKDYLDSPDEILRDKIADDVNEFNLMSQEFRDKYWARYLKVDEFEKFRPFVLGVQKDRITDLGGYEYIECATMNAGRHNFMPYLYHKDKDVVERIVDLKLRCEQCGDMFISKDFKRHKGRSRMLCLACTANMPFCIKDKPFENLVGNTVHYKTRYEAKFLRFCNKHEIEVVNGVDIIYPWLHHQLQYRIPFFIKSLGLLVDIKDNHQWRNEEDMNQLKTKNRMRSIQDFIDANQEMFKDYVVLYPGNYVKETRKMVVAYHQMTSFRAWRRFKKEEKVMKKSNLLDPFEKPKKKIQSGHQHHNNTENILPTDIPTYISPIDYVFNPDLNPMARQ